MDPAASRNLSNYLMMLDLDRVEGVPYAMTLTVPADSLEQVPPDVLHGMLAEWIRRQRRLRGLLHYCWLIEFTAVRTPHIHLTIWCDRERMVYDWRMRKHRTVPLPPLGTQALMLADWVSLCNRRGIPASMTGQDFHPVDDTPQGWLAYTAKHSVRGVTHYQRRLDSMPQTWREQPGAMWGHDRPLTASRGDTIGIPMSKEAFWVLRRTIRRHLAHQAKQIADPAKRRKAITASRRMLKRGLPPGEQREKAMASHQDAWWPQSAFMGLRAWLSPEEQHEILMELLTGLHAQYYRPLVGRPVRHPANPGQTRQDTDKQGGDIHMDAAPLGD